MNKIEQLGCSSGPIHVGIEECLKSFYVGRFNTKGVIALAQLNGIVSYACWKAFQSKPRLIHPTTARSFFRLNKDSEKSIKAVSMQFVESKEDQFQWKRNRMDNVAESNFDLADSFVVAYYTFIQEFIDDFIREETELRNSFVRVFEKMHGRRIERRHEQDTNERLVERIRDHALETYRLTIQNDIRNHHYDYFRRTSG